MNYLEVLTEPILREAFGDEAVDEALQALAGGKVINREYDKSGELAADWDYSYNSHEMGAKIEGDNLLMRCTCRDHLNGMVCKHLVSMLVAWANDRFSFFGAESTMISAQSRTGARSSNPPDTPAYDPVADYRQMLSQMTISQIREIARRRGVTITGLRKDPIVDTVAQALGQAEKFIADWNTLSPAARDLAGLVPFSEGAADEQGLRGTFAQLGFKDKNAFDEAFKELQDFGFLFRDSNDQLVYPRANAVWMPPDPDFLSIRKKDVTGLRIQAVENPRAFPQLATRLLILLQAQGEDYRLGSDESDRQRLKPSPFLSGWPIDPADLARFSQSNSTSIAKHNLRLAPVPPLLANDARLKLSSILKTSPEQLDFLMALLVEMGLLKLVPGKPVQVEANSLIQLTQDGAHRAVAKFMQQYSALQGWSDLNALVKKPKFFRFTLTDTARGRYLQFVFIMVGLRQLLMMLLRRLPADRWIDLDSLVERLCNLPIRAAMVQVTPFGRLEINDHPIKFDRDEDVQAFFRMLLESILTGPFFWLGAADLAWKGDHLSAYRMTPLGGSVLGQPEKFVLPELPADQPVITFSGEREIILNLERADSEIIKLLTELGEMEINRQNMIVFRVQLAGAGRAFEAGWSADRLLATLEQAAGSQVPKSLANTLRKWWSDFGSVQLYQDVALIELGDDYAVNELLSGTSLSRYLLYRFNSRLLAIRPEGVDVLRDELVKKGYTPRFADHPAKGS